MDEKRAEDTCSKQNNLASKEEIQSWIVLWIKRVTTDPKDLSPGSRPTPAEYGILPAMIDKAQAAPEPATEKQSTDKTIGEYLYSTTFDRLKATVLEALEKSCDTLNHQDAAAREKWTMADYVERDLINRSIAELKDFRATESKSALTSLPE